MSDNQQPTPEAAPEDTIESVAEATPEDAGESAAEAAPEDAGESVAEAAPEEPKVKKKNKETRRKVFVALFWTLIVAGSAFLIFFLAARIGQFDSIGDMFDFIKSQF